MYKFFFFLLSLFSPSISQIYAPMSTRTFEFQVDDICEYQKSSNDFIYVEPCEKDYSCQDATSSGYPQIGICTKTSYEQPTYFNKACNFAFHKFWNRYYILFFQNWNEFCNFLK